MRLKTNPDMRQHDGIILRAIATAICFAVYSTEAAPDSQRAVQSGIGQEDAKRSLLLKAETVMVPVSNTRTTLMGMSYTSPPPWKGGNYLTLYFRKPEVPGQFTEWASWDVVNMHTENFSEITRRLEIDAVEVLVFHTEKRPITVQARGRPKYRAFDDVGYALITDRRIPREWLLSEPRLEDQEIKRKLKAAYPVNFRTSD